MTKKAAEKTARTKAGSSQAAAAKKRAVFVAEYLANGGNATQAAMKAGWSTTNANAARVAGTRALAHPIVKQQISDHQKQITEQLDVKHGLTVDSILQELRRVALSDPRKLYNADGSLKRIVDLDDDSAACLAGMDVSEITEDGQVIGKMKKIKLWDKNSALEKAMKHLGLFEKDNSQDKSFKITIASDDSGVL